MTWNFVRRFLVLVVLISYRGTWKLAAQNLPAINGNDNRAPAGELRNGVLTLRLEIGEGLWHPESDTGEAIQIYAFRETGKPLQAPGPLIRVPQGTTIDATVHNALPMAVMVRGLHERPGKAGDAFTLQPGATQPVRFQAGAPGTYYYWATTTKAPLISNWTPVETELAGALIVDPAGATANDRVFVIGRRVAEDIRTVLTINGKSWPYTEHFTFTEGDIARWKWVNTSNGGHAMHMHGFYYRVDAVSNDGEKVQPTTETDPPILVTQRVPSGGTFDMTLNAEHPGRWLFHCHMIAHMTPDPDFPNPSATYDAAHAAHASDPGSGGMAGLVIGLTVLPKNPAAPAPEWKPVRKLQVTLHERENIRPTILIEVRDLAKATPPPPPAGTVIPPQLIGPPIVLRQGEATEVEVINRMKEPTGIHWHGMELDSYYDGVAGWGGTGQQTTPPIMPGETFVAKIAPLRAGSFIYHTHWHEPGQLTNALYGPLLVMPSGKEFDPATDLNFLFSQGTFEPLVNLFLINGHPQPLVMPLRTGVKYRFRLTNIAPNAVNLRGALRKVGSPVQWRLIAKDGADVPPTAAILKPADQFITVGETWDFEYQASEPEELALEIYNPGAASKLRATQGLLFTAPPAQ